MRKQTARLVYPVFRYGLRLQERLRRGQVASVGEQTMLAEQTELKKLIKAADAAPGRSEAGEPGESFLGIGYPLACWLDEVFILDPDSPWKAPWNEKSLEVALYGSRLRSDRFWEQARQAETRADADALEVFYLCVMLGFRGDYRGDPNRLADWRETTEALVEQRQPGDWPDKPPELPVPPPDVPPLRAREHLRWVLLGFALVSGAAIVATAFATILSFGTG
jgi:type VI secretion system protein ImpK